MMADNNEKPKEQPSVDAGAGADGNDVLQLDSLNSKEQLEQIQKIPTHHGGDGDTKTAPSDPINQDPQPKRHKNSDQGESSDKTSEAGDGDETASNKDDGDKNKPFGTDKYGVIPWID